MAISARKLCALAIRLTLDGIYVKPDGISAYSLESVPEVSLARSEQSLVGMIFVSPREGSNPILVLSLSSPRYPCSQE